MLIFTLPLLLFTPDGKASATSVGKANGDGIASLIILMVIGLALLMRVREAEPQAVPKE